MELLGKEDVKHRSLVVVEVAHCRRPAGCCERCGEGVGGSPPKASRLTCACPPPGHPGKLVIDASHARRDAVGRLPRQPLAPLAATDIPRPPRLGMPWHHVGQGRREDHRGMGTISRMRVPWRLKTTNGTADAKMLRVARPDGVPRAGTFSRGHRLTWTQWVHRAPFWLRFRVQRCSKRT